MGAIITVKDKYGEIDYEFDMAEDGVEFKNDLIKKKGTKITIKKTKDIPPKPDKRRYYDDKWTSK